MSERLKKNEPLSLADVVRLKKAALEWERQHAMREAENWDLMPDLDIKLPDLRALPQLTEAEMEAIRHRRGSATQFWAEIIHAPGITVEEKAKHLAAHKGKFPAHVWRKLLLDLVVDITPLDKPVPKTLIALLQDALGLPENHVVCGWPLIAGMSDDRGKPDHEARECASRIDCEYIDALLTHSDATTRRNAMPMPLNVLRREVEKKLGRTPDKKTLRDWRKRHDYWGIER
jgi:hypothetical protein